jgi:hypothetical protein
MPFMQQQITRKLTWLEVETSQGIDFLDASDFGFQWSSLAVKPWGDQDESEQEGFEEALEDYVNGEVYSVTLRVGYGARLSAPGYMDCTEWAVFDTKEEAQAYLDETYPEDEDEYEVICGNIGSVYGGNSRSEADKVFSEYVFASESTFGRASGEDVTIMQNGEIIKEHIGSNSKLEE